MSWYRDKYLKSDEWKAIKLSKESRTSKQCAVCADTNKIDLHHLFYRKDLSETQTSDLRWLCRRCHSLAHDLINSGLLQLNPNESHHALFGATRSAIRQKLGIVRIRVDNKSAAAKTLDSIKTSTGFTRKALESIGIPWPPPKGWRKQFIRDRSPLKP